MLDAIPAPDSTFLVKRSMTAVCDDAAVATAVSVDLRPRRAACDDAAVAAAAKATL